MHRAKHKERYSFLKLWMKAIQFDYFYRSFVTVNFSRLDFLTTYLWMKFLSPLTFIQRRKVKVFFIVIPKKKNQNSYLRTMSIHDRTGIFQMNYNTTLLRSETKQSASHLYDPKLYSRSGKEQCHLTFKFPSLDNWFFLTFVCGTKSSSAVLCWQSEAK